MKKNECYTLLSELLTKQIASLNVATSYLNDIKECIETNSLEGLQSLIKHNKIPLSQIEDLEISRFSLIESCGFEKDSQGFERCIKACDNSDKSLSQLNEQLNSSLSELQKATEVSGLLVAKNKTRVKNSLSILTGNSIKKDPTYSSQGTTNSDSLTRPLAIA
jgi:flagellar biosynthesis/type III secretory pathway chaperone